jgi:hypothetical protein
MPQNNKALEALRGLKPMPSHVPAKDDVPHGELKPWGPGSRQAPDLDIGRVKPFPDMLIGLANAVHSMFDPSIAAEAGDPMMGVGGPMIPGKVPPLPKGQQAIDEIRDMIDKMHKGRGKYGMPELSDMGLQERPIYTYEKNPRFGQPYTNEDMAQTITNKAIEPATQPYYDRIIKDPEGAKWFGERGHRSRYDWQKGEWITEDPPDMSPEALERMLRLLAD